MIEVVAEVPEGLVVEEAAEVHQEADEVVLAGEANQEQRVVKR